MSVHGIASSQQERSSITLLTAEQVAQVLAVSRHTVRRMADAGDLERVYIGPGARLVRFRSTDVAALMAPVDDGRPDSRSGRDATTRATEPVRARNGSSG